jgi:hypothetical protein
MIATGILGTYLPDLKSEPGSRFRHEQHHAPVQRVESVNRLKLLMTAAKFCEKGNNGNGKSICFCFS